MRCRVGDLALIVRGRNSGRLCNVVGLGWVPGTDWEIELLGGPGHAINGMGERSLKTRAGIEDWKLTPIRDGEGTDEMIRIAGLPREVAHG